MQLNWTGTQPLGLTDLEPDAATRYALRTPAPLLRGNQIRCCVRGCQRWLAKRARGQRDPAVYCPEHAISVSTSPTYVYKDYRKNFIIDLALLEQVKELKVESWRLGNERSEDAVSWNVFVSLAQLSHLAGAFGVLTGCEIDVEPELYLWGVRIAGGEPRLWERLATARAALEQGAGLPTEPDIILRVPGRFIVLIEAKFGSPNGTLKGHDDRFGSVAEFLNRYPGAAGRPDPLNRDWIEEQRADDVLQQLVRNVVFAQWLTEEGESAWVVNLVRESEARDVEQQMANHLSGERPVQFRRCSWEQLFRLPILSSDAARSLKTYVESKTNGLARAFAC